MRLILLAVVAACALVGLGLATASGLVRMAAAFGLAAGAVLALCPGYIGVLAGLGWGQPIRPEGPALHQVKAGTPTAGGLVILLGIFLGAGFLFTPAERPVALALGLALAGCAGLGFLDDHRKLTRGRNLGLRARDKLAGQVLVGLLLAVICYWIHGPSWPLWVPGAGLIQVPAPAGALLVVLVMVSVTNAVNLTDGLDGLAAGASALALAAYAVIGVWQSRPEVAVFAAAGAGACLGFLRENRHPARIFMGDVGSLGLGGLLAGLAAVTATQLLLPLLGGIFAIEAISVILQVAYFKRTGGKRLFRMSPLHHHFEQLGWPETRVTVRFWAAEALLAAAALGCYRIWA